MQTPRRIISGGNVLGTENKNAAVYKQARMILLRLSSLMVFTAQALERMQGTRLLDNETGHYNVGSRCKLADNATINEKHG